MSILLCWCIILVNSIALGLATYGAQHKKRLVLAHGNRNQQHGAVMMILYLIKEQTEFETSSFTIMKSPDFAMGGINVLVAMSLNESKSNDRYLYTIPSPLHNPVVSGL